MTLARRTLVDSHNPAFYHCTNRCVRRAFLCGVDKETGQDYNHRKTWMEQRMIALCDIFAVDIYAYTVMDNHYHIVLYLDPKAPLKWTDEQVAERWLLAYPGKMDLPQNADKRERKKQGILNNPEKLALYRQRLGCLSWYMKRLNEPLAKMSNLEDDCSGKFWQERYTSQALLDEAAIFSCMAYVDLNPVRARIIEKLEESTHTSIKKRIDEYPSAEQLQRNIESVAGHLKANTLSIKLKDYIELVEWTGQAIIHPDKASIPAHITPILERLNLQQHHWLKQIENYSKHYCHVVGPVALIRERAKQFGLRCLWGISAAKRFYLPS